MTRPSDLASRGRPMTAPCDGCCRVHRGPRCKPDERRTVSITVTLPAHVARELRERCGWGERSAFVAGAVDEALRGER